MTTGIAPQPGLFQNEKNEYEEIYLTVCYLNVRL